MRDRQQADEANQRDRAKRRGLRLGVTVNKSKRRVWAINNQQGYRVANLDGLPLAGDRWDLTLDDVDRVLDQIETRLKAEAAATRSNGKPS